MASGWSNRGCFRTLGYPWRGASIPANFYVSLATAATTPSPLINTNADMTAIAAGNGYVSGGIQLTPGATDYDVYTEDDSNNRAYLQIKDLIWTAAGGSLPISGAGARYALHNDNNGSVSAREIFQWWDLGADRSVATGQTLTLQNCEFGVNNPG